MLYNSELYLGCEKVDYYCRDSLEDGMAAREGWAGLLFLFFQIQGGRVNAISQPGGRRAIFKDMAQVAVAFAAGDLGSDHQMSGIAAFLDCIRIDGSGKGGPAATGIIFGITIITVSYELIKASIANPVNAIMHE